MPRLSIDLFFILAWNHFVAMSFLSIVFTVSAQRVNIFAESYEQPVQFMVRGDLKNMEYNLPPIIHMYRPFLMVVHLRSSLIFGSSKKSVCHFVFGLLTQISIYIYI